MAHAGQLHRELARRRQPLERRLRIGRGLGRRRRHDDRRHRLGVHGERTPPEDDDQRDGAQHESLSANPVAAADRGTRVARAQLRNPGGLLFGCAAAKSSPRSCVGVAERAKFGEHAAAAAARVKWHRVNTAQLLRPLASVPRSPAAVRRARGVWSRAAAGV
jgi:hypothetical protein